MGGNLGDIRGDVGDCSQAFQDHEEARASTVVVVAVVESRVISAMGVVAGPSASREGQDHDENGT